MSVDEASLDGFSFAVGRRNFFPLLGRLLRRERVVVVAAVVRRPHLFVRHLPGRSFPRLSA